MSKQITLPKGMTVADVSGIGTLTLVSGKTYNVDDIDFVDIRNTLGASSFDLRTLCESSLINKWAAFKPHYNPVGSNAWNGIQISNYEFIHNAPLAVAGGGFVAEHFAGYNHNAPTPGIAAYEEIAFSQIGERIGMVLLQLPEWDIQEIEPTITHLRTLLYVGESLINTYHKAIISDEIEICSVASEYTINLTTLQNYTYKLVFELGYMDGSTFVKQAAFPHDGTGALELTLTATYKADPELHFVPVNPSYITPSQGDAIVSLFTQNDTLTEGATEYSYSFDMKIEKSDQSSGVEQLAGTADVYARNPETMAYHYLKGVTFNASGWVTVSGTLPSASFPKTDITADVYIELRNIQISS